MKYLTLSITAQPKRNAWLSSVEGSINIPKYVIKLLNTHILTLIVLFIGEFSF